MDLVAAKPLEFTPVSRFKYSNAGYYVLGHLIEQVSGQVYADYLRTHIFQPFEMGQSGYDSVRDLIEGRAIGYGTRSTYAVTIRSASSAKRASLLVAPGVSREGDCASTDPQVAAKRKEVTYLILLTFPLEMLATGTLRPRQGAKARV